MPTIPLADVTLHFEETGQGAPVLLLHGLGSCGHDFDLVAPRLSLDHRVITVDVRGHGRSGKPAGPYSVPLFARDLVSFCDRLGLAAVHVVGLSMGGMIAFQLALLRPALVRSLVIINSGPDMVPRTVERWLAFTTRLLLLRLLGPRRLAKLIAGKLFPKPEQAQLRQRTVAILGANPPQIYLHATQALIGWTVLDRLSEVRCPVLILASDRDYTPLAAKQEYAARLPDARLEVITDSGHAAPLDQPEQVSEKTRRFFAAVEAA